MNEGQGKCFQNKHLPLPSCCKGGGIEMLHLGNENPRHPWSHRVLWRPSLGSAEWALGNLPLTARICCQAERCKLRSQQRRLPGWGTPRYLQGELLHRSLGTVSAAC